MLGIIFTVLTYATVLHRAAVSATHMCAGSGCDCTDNALLCIYMLAAAGARPVHSRNHMNATVFVNRLRTRCRHCWRLCLHSVVAGWLAFLNTFRAQGPKYGCRRCYVLSVQLLLACLRPCCQHVCMKVHVHVCCLNGCRRDQV